MSSFFTLPASQRKRKKATSGAAAKKQKTGPRRGNDTAGDDDEVASSDSEDGAGGRRGEGGDDDYESGSDSGYEGETAAERRLRLAQRYLENVKTEVDLAGFDAADVDRDLIADRLKEDTAVTKGKVYRFISDGLDIGGAAKTFFRTDGNPVYAVAGKDRFVYTARKDGSIVKWELPGEDCEGDVDADNDDDDDDEADADEGGRPTKQPRRPVKRGHVKGRMIKPIGKGKDARKTFVGHSGPILAIAVSPSGKFLATGGKDKRVILWTTSNMKPFRCFAHHRASVTSLAFKLQSAPANSQNKTTASETLYSASADRSIKVWAIDKLTSAYTETLFGHQDSIMCVDALFEDRCVSVGSRDRTVRLWKVSEESQMVFRAGGCGALPKPQKAAAAGLDEVAVTMGRQYHEGSTDCVAILDNELFVTGADNGAISLWSSQKKKPVFTFPLGHGLDRAPLPEEYSTEADPGPVQGLKPRPRGITAIKAVPLSDLFVTGSWDGYVRAWKLRSDRKSFESLGPIGGEANASGLVDGKPVEADQTGPRIDTGAAALAVPPHRRLSISQPGSSCSLDSGPSLATSTLSLASSFPSSLKSSSSSTATTTATPTGPRPIVGIVNDIAVFETGSRGKEVVHVVAAVGKEHRLMKRLVVGAETVGQDGKNGSVAFTIRRRTVGSV